MGLSENGVHLQNGNFNEDNVTPLEPYFQTDP